MSLAAHWYRRTLVNAGLASMGESCPNTQAEYLEHLQRVRWYHSAPLCYTIEPETHYSATPFRPAALTLIRLPIRVYAAKEGE
jgi:hypothetical protein